MKLFIAIIVGNQNSDLLMSYLGKFAMDDTKILHQSTLYGKYIGDENCTTSLMYILHAVGDVESSLENTFDFTILCLK